MILKTNVEIPLFDQISQFSFKKSQECQNRLAIFLHTRTLEIPTWGKAKNASGKSRRTKSHLNRRIPQKTINIIEQIFSWNPQKISPIGQGTQQTTAQEITCKTEGPIEHYSHTAHAIVHRVLHHTTTWWKNRKYKNYFWITWVLQICTRIGVLRPTAHARMVTWESAIKCKLHFFINRNESPSTSNSTDVS